MPRQVHIADRSYACPVCAAPVSEQLEKLKAWQCPDCHTAFKVMADAETGRTALFAPLAARQVEPLGLPRGSVRALVALGLSATCWALVAGCRDLPPALLSLTLTVIGFYFGFRSHTDPRDDRIYDAWIHREQPLNLPGGIIRVVLVLGFGISGLVLYSRGWLNHIDVLEFFAILTGVVAGYLLSKVMTPLKRSRLYDIWRHVRALLVLAATALAAVMALQGSWTIHGGRPFMLLTAGISFYFGSRST
ncbi:MAG: hypothetical protein GVY16_04260 [Planctomycetes bacterium]|jgi:DNA-directed RNA polymerase subunit RPC12/RpoP|nr:hypothetical protein [Phycisphaerae bacterium]NBB94934.1 hypothetical protein [Planctomycetota bacterium]